MSVDRFRDNLAKAVLLFHGGGVWGLEEDQLWRQLVADGAGLHPLREPLPATTRVLCDLARACLEKSENESDRLVQVTAERDDLRRRLEAADNIIEGYGEGEPPIVKGALDAQARAESRMFDLQKQIEEMQLDQEQAERAVAAAAHASGRTAGWLAGRDAAEDAIYTVVSPNHRADEVKRAIRAIRALQPPNPLLIPANSAIPDELQRELDEMQRTFDLMWAADQRGIQMWQAEDPANRQRMWPDRGKLVSWLLTKLDEAEKKLSAST